MIAEIFNNFFVNIGPNLARDIPTSNIEFHSFLRQAQDHTMFFSPVTTYELTDIVNNMKAKKVLALMVYRFF